MEIHSEILWTVGNRKQYPLEEKTDLFTVSRKVVLRIEFCSSSHLLPFPEGQRQASSGCTNIVHQDKLPFTCHSVWSTIRLSFASLHILDVSAGLLDKASKNAVEYKSTNLAELPWFVSSLSSQSWHHSLSEDALVGMASRV